MRKTIIILAALSLQGCVAKLAGDIVTAPIKIASKSVDLLTTSQSEKDEKRGRNLRQRDENMGRLSREYDYETARCNNGNAKACNKAEALEAEIQSEKTRAI